MLTPRARQFLYSYKYILEVIGAPLPPPSAVPGSSIHTSYRIFLLFYQLKPSLSKNVLDFDYF